MNKFTALKITVALLLLISGCNATTSDPNTNNESYSAIEKDVSLSESEDNHDNPSTPDAFEPYGEMLFGFTPEEYVDFITYNSGVIQNYSRLIQWLDSYKTGEPATIQMVLEGHPAPYGLILTSQGTSQIDITFIDVSGEPQSFLSDYIIEREYDFLIGDDIPFRLAPFILPKEEYLSLKLVPNEALSMQQSFLSVSDAKVLIGDYIEENELELTEYYDKIDLVVDDCLYSLDGKPFYYVEGFDQDNTYTGCTYAISADDGALILYCSSIDGSWSLEYDGNAQRITV